MEAGTGQKCLLPGGDGHSRGFCQSHLGIKKFSDAHRHTSEMDNKGVRGE